MPERFFIMLMIGLILFVFLLILFWRVVIWFVGTIGAAKGLEEEYRKYTTYLGVFIAVATILFLVADEIYTDKQFKQLCQKEAGLKVYKKVDKIDGFLYLSNYIDNPEYYKEFKFYENVDRSNKYKIKEYYTKKENNQYFIDYFIVMTERKHLGHGKFKETLKKEIKINFNDYKINRYSFSNGEEYLKEENIHPKSRYILLDTDQSLLNKFGLHKNVLVDTDDYSVIAERIFIKSGGGKWSRFLGSFYGGGVVGRCGLPAMTPDEFIKRIFQPTVQ